MLTQQEQTALDMLLECDRRSTAGPVSILLKDNDPSIWDGLDDRGYVKVTQATISQKGMTLTEAGRLALSH